VKALFADRQFNATHRLGAVNSINWARILAQTVYYFLSYFHARASLPASASGDVSFEYVVPTGNFGDILAGYYAKRMGLPIRRLVVATNSNDILARFWKSGRYEKVDPDAVDEGVTEPAHGASDGKQAMSGGVRETLSPAMDILVSSNFERLLWYLAYESVAEPQSEISTEIDGQGALERTRRNEACSILDGWMSKVKSDGQVEVPVAVLEAARRDFTAERISDEQVSSLASFQLRLLFMLYYRLSTQSENTLMEHLLM
jgi:threonine synthase